MKTSLIDITENANVVEKLTSANKTQEEIAT